jgi:hypothetical protein
VVGADIDNMIDPNNVITFSNKQKEKIRTIDEYNLIPRTTHETNWVFYTEFNINSQLVPRAIQEVDGGHGVLTVTTSTDDKGADPQHRQQIPR